MMVVERLTEKPENPRREIELFYSKPSENLMHSNVIILVIVCGACLITDVQLMKCSIGGAALRRVDDFLQRVQHYMQYPKCKAKDFKRFNDECKRLKVAQNAHDLTAAKRIQYRSTEMKILQMIEHPFIVKLHWSLWNEKYAVMIFDYYQMDSFFDLIASTGPLSEEKAKFYTAQLVLAFEYLHETKHIVHRDIKDENILVDNEGYLKILADFLIVRSTQKEKYEARDLASWPRKGTRPIRLNPIRLNPVRLNPVRLNPVRLKFTIE
ncbi:protein kinase domain-containing protein [Ditylenchus destructor]|uniref:Protein kinase domain-containing protein n=1 Tax=Ditylenchus destructor TaxID=166010 RepID=A0AAD4MRA4_9BILA|nr:protein kinase domain-containing protein [Ditylenchus destructor]